MPSVPLYPSRKTGEEQLSPNTFSPLPPLLQTPSGLAILELQGTINIPSASVATTENDDEDSNGGVAHLSNDNKDVPGGGRRRTIETELGKLVFPDYIDGMDPDNSDTTWMKRVYLFVGRYQRMTGEVKKLAKPLAVIQRRQRQTSSAPADTGAAAAAADERDELEIVDIIKYKIIFASRPEPVGVE